MGVELLELMALADRRISLVAISFFLSLFLFGFLEVEVEVEVLGRYTHSLSLPLWYGLLKSVIDIHLGSFFLLLLFLIVASRCLVFGVEYVCEEEGWCFFEGGDGCWCFGVFGVLLRGGGEGRRGGGGVRMEEGRGLRVKRGGWGWVVLFFPFFLLFFA